MTGTYAAGNEPFDRLGAVFRAMSHRGHAHHQRHGGHHHARRGDFPWGGGGFGFGGPPFGRGRKARRGDVRAAALVLLDEEPRNGYQLMQEIEERSDGAWRPSPGSVYPALQQLEDEGLVRTREIEGRRVFELTDEGRAHVEEKRDELGKPWEAFAGDMKDEYREAGMAIKDVAIAAAQVIRSGNPEHVEQAGKVLNDAKRSLYLILAEED
jgi:DNA-binding PadR family transcriptional regulator